MKLFTIKYMDVILRFFVLVALFAFLSVVLEGCGDKCSSTNTYYYYEPVYTPLAEIRELVDIEPPRIMETSGKIYIYGSYLFVNEPGEGIHVINNIDPSNPEFLNFIHVPGNVDIAVKDNILYADSYYDLIAFDISTVDDIKIAKRLDNIFVNVQSLGFAGSAELGVVTDWIQTESVERFESDCDTYGSSIIPWEQGVFVNNLDVASFSASAESIAPIASANGQGGSLARFAIANQHLYTIDDWQMYIFDASNAADPVYNSTVEVGWGIETIFPYKDHLFIGANNGMHIYNNLIPAQPEYLSSFLHVVACDPVVVDDTYAYVTLRSNTNCNGFVNQLDIINIEDLTNPFLVRSYPMQNPHGLGVDDDKLFLCEGEFGLKTYNIEDRLKIDENLIGHIDDIHAYDVIPYNDVLIMIGDDGLYQYDYSDSEELTLLSKISINPTNP